MKKNIFFLIAISTGLSLHGGVLYLQNLYRKPIQIKINGQVIQGALIKTGEKARLIDINNLQSLAIKTPESLQFKNLDTEIKTIKTQAAQSIFKGQQDVVLTIPDTNNILVWKSGLIQWVDKLDQGLLISADPIKNLFNGKIDGYNCLEQISDQSYPYGKEFAERVYFVKTKNDSQYRLLGRKIEFLVEQAKREGKTLEACKPVIVQTIYDLYNKIRVS